MLSHFLLLLVEGSGQTAGHVLGLPAISSKLLRFVFGFDTAFLSISSTLFRDDSRPDEAVAR
jgi:hypothetical protein